MMRKKRILYNELNEEIYESEYWTKSKLIFLAIILLILGFLANFSLEEKLNHFFINTLAKNPNCSIQYEKFELSYLIPKFTFKKPIILGNCFDQPSNRLVLDQINIKLDFPSITHMGIRLSIEINAGKQTQLLINPIFSLFSTYIEIEHSKVDAKIFQAFSSENKSFIAGILALNGFLKFESGILTDGDLIIESNNFHFPAQRISGFDLTPIVLNKLNFHAHFPENVKDKMRIAKLEIGSNSTPIYINLKGNLNISKTNFGNSTLILDGNLHLSQNFMSNFSFITLLLPQGHTDGKYLMKIHGPLTNPGAPIFQ